MNGARFVVLSWWWFATAGGGAGDITAPVRVSLRLGLGL